MAAAVRTDWHAIEASACLDALDSRPSGLGAPEAERRLAADGLNALTATAPASAMRILVAQFQSVVVALLVGAMALSFAMGDLAETVAIGVVIALTTGMGFVLELRARRAMEALGRLVAQRAVVVRDGKRQWIDASRLVAGDVVELSSGQTVPADARVLTETDLRTDEAALTGESMPVSKHTEPVADVETPLADRASVVFQGTTVVSGLAHVVVIATGDRTEVGRIGALTHSVDERRTPLERRLDELGHRLVWVSLAVAGVVAALGLAQGEPLGLMLETAIAIAVAAVPEGLPAVATITLAIGLRRLARRHALVRRLPAVESLGSATLVCSDKTRTLTSGDMTVVQVWAAGSDCLLESADPRTLAPSDPVVLTVDVARRASRSVAAAAPGETGRGDDPVDRAVMAAAARLLDGGVLPVVETTPDAWIPFSSERKFMAAFHGEGPRAIAYVKGAPQRVVEMCDQALTVEGTEVVDAAARDRLLAENRRLAAAGLRVLAVARGEVAGDNETALRGLTFVGFLGLMDPPAPGVREAIATLKSAGLRTVMLTGDQRHTAEAVGRALGVLGVDDGAIDSRELRTLTPAALAGRLAATGVFSRIAPEDKLTIVRAFQARGDVVAMLGDGVNDAPALRQADVGVAMGTRGTDVAKEAAAIVLQDDRFETIVAAVEEGRVIFDNIRKFVFYLFSCNLAEVLVLLVASVAGLPLPLLPLQILWLNLVTDTFPALALAVEPGDEDVMRRPPRDPRAAMLSRTFLSSVTGYAMLITAATLAAYVWALDAGLPHATTVAFMTLALAQTFHLGNARSGRHVLSPGRALANPYAIAAVAVSGLLQLVAIYVGPIAAALGVVPLSAREWLVVLAAAAMPAVVGQAIRLARGAAHPRAASGRA
jgi:Ca2+-transporting ATPase